MHRYWIWLSQRKDLSNRGREALLEALGTAEAVYQATDETLAEIPELSKKDLAALSDHDLSEAGKIYDQCVAKGIHLCVFTDPWYPARLKNISDPPMVLY